MQRNVTELGWNDCLRPANPTRAMGAALITLSLLRWPATALLVSPAWELPEIRWILILTVQTSAEAIFWLGVWLVGRRPLRRALARVAETWPVRTILASKPRVRRLVHPGSEVPGV